MSTPSNNDPDAVLTDPATAVNSDFEATRSPRRHGAEHVVHLIAALRRDEMNLLCPTVLALADAGVSQSVVMMDERDADFVRAMLPRSVAVFGAGARRLLGPGQDVAKRLRAELSGGPVMALHLHGLGALRQGLTALRATSLETPLFLHLGADPAALTLSRRWMSSLALRSLATLGRGQMQTYVVHRQHVSPVASFMDPSGFFLRQPVREAYFAVRREEHEHPLVVTSGRADDLALAQAFSQIAVLLAGSHPHLHFAWIGPCSASVRQVLQAANVRLELAPTSAQRAAAMARGWIYLVPDAAGADGVPLAQAMAVGLPCVVSDTPANREFVIHRLCGLVCRDRARLLASIAVLVDSQPLRRTLGHAARGRARHQAGRHRFRASLLLAHGLHCPDPD